MESSQNQNVNPMKRAEKDIQFLRDIDRVLLAEEQLLTALKTAVQYNSLELAEAEEVLFDFRHTHGLEPPPPEAA